MASVRHDAHARPPDRLRQLFKKWQKVSLEALSSSHDILDLSSLTTDDRTRECKMFNNDLRRAKIACEEFINCKKPVDLSLQLRCFEVKSLPGGQSKARVDE